MFNNYLDVLLSILAGSGLTLLIVGFLAKRLINQLLNKELENYKSQLTAKTEILKSNIAIFAHEQNIAATRVDSQKSEAIHAVYSALRQIIHPVAKIAAGSNLVNAEKINDIKYYLEHSEMAHQKSIEFAQVLGNNAIYFSNEIYGEISDLSASVSKINATFLQILRQGCAEGWATQELYQKMIEQQKVYSEALDKVVHPELSKLTNIFRQELGIHKT